MFRYKCATCDEWHEGIPSFGTDAPLDVLDIPEGEREARCVIDTDLCAIDRERFFVRGCLEIPVERLADRFTWLVWVSLSKADFRKLFDHFEDLARSHIGPFNGWLSADFPFYPPIKNLEARVHIRDNGFRPLVELESTDHPLAVEQRTGITVERVSEICGYYAHKQSD
jgi:hypothetical protein